MRALLFKSKTSRLTDVRNCIEKLQRGTFATSQPAENLHNSLSDGFYDVGTSSDKTNRPMSFDPQVTHARRSQQTRNSLPGILHDSLSEADHVYRPRSLSRQSVAEPEYYLGNSLSDGVYDMPTSLRASSRTLIRGGHGHSAASPRSLPILQKVVAHPGSRFVAERLSNSFSDAEYT